MRFALVVIALVGCNSDRVDEPPKKTPWVHTEAQRRAAIGDVSTLSPELQRAFDPIAFVPTPPPNTSDWLDVYDEPGQTFAEHQAGKFHVPDDVRRVLYILPLGDFGADVPSPATLARIAHAYFGLEVRVLPAVPLADVEAKRRGLDVRGRPSQMFVADVLRWLVPRVPDDAQALIAVTMMDLYPDDKTWFTFGQGSFYERVAVESFARFDPEFYNGDRKPDWQKVMLARAAFTTIHELGHTFGLAHCTYYECVFAGVTNRREIDRRPLHACPICLRKLHAALKFDPARREDDLAAVFAELALDEEAAWSKQRAAWIRTGSLR